MREPWRSKGETLQVTLINSIRVQIINTTGEADVHLGSMMPSFPVGSYSSFSTGFSGFPPLHCHQPHIPHLAEQDDKQ